MSSESAPTHDVDTEATAELPVLDVAAYEATLEMPVVMSQTIPTLAAAVPAYDLDHSGTHEMPQRLAHQVRRAGRPEAARPAAKVAMPPAPTPAPTSDASAPEPRHVALEIPPSPPLIDDLRKSLAQAEQRIAELEARARIADAERAVAVGRANAECAQLREQLGAHLESLATANGRLGVQRADESGLEDACFASADRIAGLQRELAAQEKVLAETRAQLAAAGRRGEGLEADIRNLRDTIARRDAQIRMLEADLQARQEREAQLRTRLEEALRAVDPDVVELRAELGRAVQASRDLKAELELTRARVGEKEGDLEVAEENLRQLENELRSKTNKLEEASVTVEEWRAVIAESQRSILQRDSRIRELESDLEKRGRAAPPAIDQTGEEIALEGPARVLIRTDGNTDFVHVLGRRTRIGRGPDNELVLDTKHVSRYHAVLLAGPAHTSIEDLNSTNGVFVNGKRVNRQALKDGDRVTIGRTQFRYTVRD